MSAARKVLLAESDPATALARTRDLREQGYEVIAGNDAIHVLNAARHGQPDVILLSGQLAGGGAAVALRRLRSNVYTTGIPVIGLVGRGGAGERDLMSAGAQACVPAAAPIEAVRQAMDLHMLQSLDFTQAPAEVLEAPARIEALQASALLDSPAEEAFDRLTRLTSSLLGAPTALVTLVDKDRQFFKSQFGLREPYAADRQTRLSHSFCQWVVSGREELVVADAKEHPVLRSNLAIQQLGVIAYAGVPLEGRGGEAIGSVCAIDSTARQWTEDDLATLRDLARVAQAYGVLAQAHRAAGGDGLKLSLHVAGHAIQGATRTLQRYGPRLTDGERDDLLAILEEQSRQLVALVER